VVQDTVVENRSSYSGSYVQSKRPFSVKLTIFDPVSFFQFSRKNINALKISAKSLNSVYKIQDDQWVFDEKERKCVNLERNSLKKMLFIALFLIRIGHHQVHIFNNVKIP